VSIDGVQRVLAQVPGNVFFNDVSPDGRVLFTMAQPFQNLMFAGPGVAKERNLGWIEQTKLAALSVDAKTVLFTDRGQGVGARYGDHTYLRPTDGSPAVRLGEGSALSLSPDGQWAISRQVSSVSECVLLPTEAGEQRRLPVGNLECLSTSWFPDGKRLLVTGKEPGSGIRAFIQDLDGARPPLDPARGCHSWRQRTASANPSTRRGRGSSYLLLDSREPGKEC
jgi:hypothetical protein